MVKTEKQQRVERTMFGFNFEKVVLDQFRKHCKDNQLNMSAVVRNMLEEFLQNKEGDQGTVLE